MESIFEELDWQKTPLGEISLRKRSEPKLNNQLVYEVKLGDEFLMSSLFVEAEEQLSVLGLARLRENGHKHDLEVIVGGLGLGYTALTAMNDNNVSNVRTVDVMQAVISWHQRGLLPIGDVLATHPKSELIHDDFFAVATNSQTGFMNNNRVHAVLLDIDHSPNHWLNEDNQHFYSSDSLQKVANKIITGGVFALWSNELPDQQVTDLLNTAFTDTQATVVSFDNPYTGEKATNSIYVSTVR